jgi:hypothetical protein
MNDFVWHGEKIVTIRDMLDAIVACRNKREACLFMKTYSRTNPKINVKDEIGYMAGYLSLDEQNRVYELFDCWHPCLGKERINPLEAGKILGEKIRDGQQLQPLFPNDRFDISDYGNSPIGRLFSKK